VIKDIEPRYPSVKYQGGDSRYGLRSIENARL